MKCEIHRNVVALCVLGGVSTQCNPQPVVIQNRWVKSAGEPSNLVDGLGSDFPQTLSLHLNLCQRPSVFQRAQAD